MALHGFFMQVWANVSYQACFIKFFLKCSVPTIGQPKVLTEKKGIWHFVASPSSIKCFVLKACFINIKQEVKVFLLFSDISGSIKGQPKDLFRKFEGKRKMALRGFSKFEQMFRAKFASYKHKIRTQTFFAFLRYQISENLKGRWHFAGSPNSSKCFVPSLLHINIK